MTTVGGVARLALIFLVAGILFGPAQADDAQGQAQAKSKTKGEGKGEAKAPFYGFRTSDLRASFAAMPEAEKRRIVREFSDLLHSSMTIMDHNHFLGIPTWQNPFDVWATQELIYETNPDVIIEAGTFKGGSALLWAMFLEQVSPDRRVITIDIADKRVPKARTHRLASKVDFLLGSSADPKIVADIKRRVDGKRVLVILDSLHTEEHVAKELAAYARLVPVGGYLVIQDTPVGGRAAIRKFVAANDDFEIDKSRERLLFTVNVDGFVKRVR